MDAGLIRQTQTPCRIPLRGGETKSRVVAAQPDATNEEAYITMALRNFSTFAIAQVIRRTMALFFAFDRLHLRSIPFSERETVSLENFSECNASGTYFSPELT